MVLAGTISLIGYLAYNYLKNKADSKGFKFEEYAYLALITLSSIMCATLTIILIKKIFLEETSKYRIKNK